MRFWLCSLGPIQIQMGVAGTIFDHTLQILEINKSFETSKMVLLYLDNISFSFWYKKMATSSPSIYRDIQAQANDYHRVKGDTLNIMGISNSHA